MNFLLRRICCVAAILLLLSCVSKPPPYSCGPVMDKKSIKQTFQPILTYMELKPGDVFADVGASSGYFTVMMSTLVDSVTYYVQDIDTVCLNKRELNKVIDYYSKLEEKPLSATRSYIMTIGSQNRTQLPDNTFDKIYTNGTFHQFSQPDSIVLDLYQKLKPTGALFIRDSFFSNKEQYCSDKKCAKLLVKVEDFLAIMKRYNFHLEKNKEFSGYPVFKFKKGIAR